MASKVSILLSSTAQAQLAKLKEANQVPISKIDAKKSAVSGQQSAVTTLQSDVTQLKSALTKLKTATTQSEQADAIKSFVQEFNDLNKNLATYTGKDGKLQTTSEVRQAKLALRNPFLDSSVQAALKSSGVNTTQTGMEFTGALTSTVDFSALTAAFDSTVANLDSSFSSASNRFSSQLNRIAKERERVVQQVERADKRTELNYIKMYQTMQVMNAGSNSVSLFG